MQSINEDINDKLLEYYHQIKTDDIILAQKNYLKVIDHKEQQEVKLKELENEEKENNKEQKIEKSSSSDNDEEDEENKA